jgi:hypothetical protein
MNDPGDEHRKAEQRPGTPDIRCAMCGTGTATRRKLAMNQGVRVDVNEAARNMVVNVVAVGVRRFRIRTWLAFRIMHAASWIAPFRVEISHR